MTILELKRFFKSELSELYTEAESAELFSIFTYRIVGYDRFQQRRFRDQEVLLADIDEFKNIISELKTGKPFQQITCETEFYRMTFKVNEHVLIPRPETEELLELAIFKMQDAGCGVQGAEYRMKILDIGTGSGVIPIVLKKHFPNAEVSAIDFSDEALKVAKENAEIHQTEINYIHQNYLEEELSETYDIIISNPPYIGIDEEDEIVGSVKDFEPNMALFSPTSDPLIFYRKIADDAKIHLSENGMIFLEINQKLGAETLALFNDFSEKKLIKDLSDNDRFIFVRK